MANGVSLSGYVEILRFRAPPTLVSLGGSHASRMDGDSQFQLTTPWCALGVVTPERLAAMRAEWARGEDRSPEHYRWRAFCAFLAERRPLAPELAQALYQLGLEDPDRAMGEAMMHRVVELPECPDAVVEAAEASGVRHLAKAAARHRAVHSPRELTTYGRDDEPGDGN